MADIRIGAHSILERRRPAVLDGRFDGCRRTPEMGLAVLIYRVSAVVGSMMDLTSATLLAGKPPCFACSRTNSSLVAL